MSKRLRLSDRWAPAKAERVQDDEDVDPLAIVPNGYNPVYPYGPTNSYMPGVSFPIPPYYLPIQVELPLFNDQDGLHLKIGAGLAVDASGALETTGTIGSIAVQPPLQNDGTAGLKLNIGSGLAVQNGTLVVTISDPNPIIAQLPLEYGPNGLTLKLGSGLVVSPQGALTVPALKIKAPLQNGTDGALELKLASGVTVNSDGALTTTPPQVTAPLKSDTNGIALQIGSGLSLADGVLVANQTQFQAPLTKEANNQVSLTVGEGLSVSNGALVAQQLQFLAPLSKTNQQVQLSLGPGLQVSSNALTVQVQNPLTNDALTGLGLKLGTGLTLNAQGQLTAAQLELNNPLEMQTHGLGLKVGPGLSINENGALIATEIGDAGGPLWTLWNGKYTLGFYINKGTTNETSIFTYLYLNRQGPIINGRAELASNKTVPVGEWTLILKFRIDGSFDKQASDIINDFGWYVPGSDFSAPNSPYGFDWLKMMPNTFVYPPTNTKYVKKTVYEGYVDSLPGRPVNFFVIFNKDTDSEHPYTIKFIWKPEATSGKFLATLSPATFSYTAQVF